MPVIVPTRQANCDPVLLQDVRLSALRELAGRQAHPIARNFYLTAALCVHDLIDWTVDTSLFVEQLDMKDVLNLDNQSKSI